MKNKIVKKIPISPAAFEMPLEKYRAARMYGESSFNMIVLPTMYIAHNAFAELITRATMPKNKKFYIQKRKVYIRDASNLFDRIMEECIENKRDEFTRNYLYRYNDLVSDKFHSKIVKLHEIVASKMAIDNKKDIEIFSWAIVISGLLKYSCQVCESITRELTEIFHKNVFEDIRKDYSLSEVERLVGLFIDEISIWYNNIRDYEIQKIPETAEIIEDIDLSIRKETILESSQNDAKEEFSAEMLKENEQKAKETISVIQNDITSHVEKYKNLMSDV